MKYLSSKPFTGGVNSKEFRNGFEKTFGTKKPSLKKFCLKKISIDSVTNLKPGESVTCTNRYWLIGANNGNIQYATRKVANNAAKEWQRKNGVLPCLFRVTDTQIWRKVR